MQVTIHGPNLHDQSQGTFHVHAAGCRDNQREVRMNGSENPWTLEVDSAQAVVEEVYADQMAEHEAGDKWSTWTPYLSDFAFYPCVKDLPCERSVERCAVCGGDLNDHWVGACPDVTVTVTAEVALALVAAAGVEVGDDLTAATRSALVALAAGD
jgi:hypothetical protein